MAPKGIRIGITLGLIWSGAWAVSARGEQTSEVSPFAPSAALESDGLALLSGEDGSGGAVVVGPGHELANGLNIADKGPAPLISKSISVTLSIQRHVTPIGRAGDAVAVNPLHVPLHVLLAFA